MIKKKVFWGTPTRRQRSAKSTDCRGLSLSIPEKGTYLFSQQFMVSLEYLPYYCKLFNHIWQLYTLAWENFSTCLNLAFDLYQANMIKKVFFLGTPARHRRLAKSTDHSSL